VASGSGGFVGREAERNWFDQHLGRADEACAFVLVGEAGVGKSRTLAVACEVAAAAQRYVFTGRAVPHSDLPFRPLFEAFSQGTRRLGLPDDSSLVPFRGALGQIIPEWSAAGHGVAEPLVVGEGALRFLRALMAGRRALLALEDLHWADPDTVSVVEYLCEHGPEEGISVAVTVRDEETEGGQAEALRRLRVLAQRQAVSWLRLAPLGDDEVAEICTLRLGGHVPGEVTQFVVEHADGLPFAAEELLAGMLRSGALTSDGGEWRVRRLLAPNVPDSASLSIWERLGDLVEEERAAIEEAAVIGRSFDWRLVAAATGLDDVVIGKALRRGVELGLLSEDAPSQSYRFRHALSREAIVRALPAPVRARAAEAALESLRASNPGLDGDSLSLAAELALTADDKTAARACWPPWQKGH
jgi:predicted ATPase